MQQPSQSTFVKIPNPDKAYFVGLATGLVLACALCLLLIIVSNSDTDDPMLITLYVLCGGMSLVTILLAYICPKTIKIRSLDQ